MALALVKEDGSGKVDANTYVEVADGDAYHEGSLWATDWTGATTADKERALVMASRMLDALYVFHGWKANADQALRWPRANCLNPDAALTNEVGWQTGSRFWASDAIPKALKDAVCELARLLLTKDPQKLAGLLGLKEFQIESGVSVTFDPAKVRGLVPETVRMLMRPIAMGLASEQANTKLSRC